MTHGGQAFEIFHARGLTPEDSIAVIDERWGPMVRYQYVEEPASVTSGVSVWDADISRNQG